MRQAERAYEGTLLFTMKTACQAEGVIFGKQKRACLDDWLSPGRCREFRLLIGQIHGQ